MKYVFVDKDNGGTPTNATPDTSTSKYHTTSSWPANGARWSTLNAAVDDADIFALADDVTFYCIGSADDTAQVTFGASPSWTSITIIGDVTGPVWDASKYTLSQTGGVTSCMNLTVNLPTTISNVQFSHTGTATTPLSLQINNSSAVTFNIDSCHVRIGGSGTGSGYGIRQSASTANTVNIYNCTVQQVGTPGGARFGLNFSAGPTVNVYNCVVEGFSHASGIGVDGVDVVKNCAVFNNTDDFNGGTISYCASDDGDGTNAQTGVTWANEFNDYANGDFTLLSGSTKCKDNGVNDPGSGLFSDDITGTTRSGSWDIGAYEYPASTTSTPYITVLPQLAYRRANR